MEYQAAHRAATVGPVPHALLERAGREDDEHRRLALERFLALDGTDTAFVTIAVIGRLSDREGLNDLLERVAAAATR